MPWREITQVIVFIGSAGVSGFFMATLSGRVIRRPLRWYEQVTLCLVAILVNQVLFALLWAWWEH